jgi:hypothetical protein
MTFLSHNLNSWIWRSCLIIPPPSYLSPMKFIITNFTESHFSRFWAEVYGARTYRFAKTGLVDTKASVYVQRVYTVYSIFYILLTVHHVMFLGNWHNVMHKFFSICLFLFITLYMFLTHSAHHQERQIVFFQPAHISATNIEWLLPGAVLVQFVSPDDEHCVIETCREL